jgi:hypothetical protein
MSKELNPVVPVWTLATEPGTVPVIFDETGMTESRLAELRTVLATMASVPVVTLEAHPLPAKRASTGGIVLNAASPLAQQLSRLIADTAKSAPANANISQTGEGLYRMVVSAKVAEQMGNGLAKLTPSKAAAGGVYGAIRGAKGFVGNATFVPVAGTTAAAGAATGTVATAGTAAAAMGALTVAAPLVLMALAVAASAHAEHERAQAIEKITDLLGALNDANLNRERSDLDGCRDAIEKATSILLDQGRIGHSLGLDSASFAISSAIEASKRRLKKWEDGLAALPEGPVELSSLVKVFPGINENGGAFRAHLELARLAIALKRRVIVLQAVEHAQLDDKQNPFKSFIVSLRDDERRVDELETAIGAVLMAVSTLELKRQGGLRSPVFTPNEVDQLLKSAYRIRSLGAELAIGQRAGDVAIEIERSRDGALIVFPAVEA